jgi:hypothetical protein
MEFSRDTDFLYSCLEPIAETDPFISKMIEVSKRVKEYSLFKVFLNLDRFIAKDFDDCEK